MSAIAISSDGAVVFLALQNVATGDQIIAKASRGDLSAWSAAYSPGDGTSANVVMVPHDIDKMLFYGNFGTNVVVLSHTISTVANADISPVSLAAKVVNTIQSNPGDANEIVATVDTDQDMLRTGDLGATAWDVWEAALSFDATALWLLWSGLFYPHRFFAAGYDGANNDLLYSPNEGSSNSDFAGASLAAAGKITGVEI